jgi:RimJ/RimL family protein N-acetyltransferase
MEVSSSAPAPALARQPTLETPRLLLRPLVPADAAAVQTLAGDREVAYSTLNIPHPYPDGAAEAWIGTLPVAYDCGEAVVFGLALREDGALVGTCGLKLELSHARAEIGYWIGRHYWGRGLATEAARAVIEYAFTRLGIRRVYAHYYSRNPASGAVMRKLGMTHEGKLRSHVLKWGVFEDIELYGVLKDEWGSHRDTEAQG